MEIINWKELLYPYEQTVAELLIKFKSIQKECKNLGVYCPIESVSARVKKRQVLWIKQEESRFHLTE